MRARRGVEKTPFRAIVLSPAQRFNLPNFPMAAANDLRKGQAIKYNGNTAIVLDVHHRTPGNLRAFVQAIIRYINTGKSADVRFGSTDKVELVDINRTTLEFSYKDNNGYHFMDPETYDTVTLQDSLLGEAKDYLVENLPVQVLYAEGKARSEERRVGKEWRCRWAAAG